MDCVSQLTHQFTQHQDRNIAKKLEIYLKINFN